MTQITAPGVYPDISAEDYHADNFLPEPSLSSSIAKLLVTPGGTPLHAWTESARLNPEFEREEKTMFDLGAAAHALLLGDPRDFEICDYPDWRAKGAPFAREQARKVGMIPILAKHWERTIEMVAAARAQLASHEEGRRAFVDGKPEVTICWREGDVWMRARLDWLPNSGDLFFDYKSTGASADPDSWGKTMLGMGAEFQNAFYCRGIRALGLSRQPQLRFVVQENYKPFALSVVGLMPGLIDLADRQVERAIALWSECRRTGLWPGYPRRTAFVDAPPWHEAQVLAREERRADADKAAHALADEFHRPLERARP